METKWFWFQENNTLRSFEFQTVIDTLAFAENLPLRVLDCQALDKMDANQLWELKDQPSDKNGDKKLEKFVGQIQQLFKNISPNQPPTDKKIAPLPPAFDLLCSTNNDESNQTQEQAHQFLRQLGSKVWLNLPSNPLPVYTLFRHCQEWRLFTLAWFYCNKDKIKSQQDVSLSAFGMDAWTFYFYPIDLGQTPGDFRLVVGPIYNENYIGLTGEEFEEQCSCHIQNSFKAFYKWCATQGLTRLSKDNVIKHTIHTRTVISKKQVTQYALEAQEVMRMINNMSWPNNNCQSFDLFVMTRAFIALTKKKHNFTQLIEDEAQFNFLIRQKKSENTENSKTIENKSLVIIYDKKTEHFSGKFIIYEPADKPEKYDNHFLIEVKGQLHGEKDLKTCLIDVLTQCNDDIHFRQHSLHTIHGTILNEWLHNHYGYVEPDNVDDNHFYNHLCKIILEELRADCCDYYRVDHLTDQVKVLGSAYSQPKYEKLRKQHKDKMEGALSNADKNKSVVFKTLRTGKVGFLTDIEDKNTILIRKKIKDYINSIITVPIFFQGRIYGVLEIIGSQRYQFRWDHQLFLADFADILGEYLYNQQFIFSLQKLTHLAFQIEEENAIENNNNLFTHKHNPYNDELCYELSKLFLASCVNLWMINTEATTDKLNYQLLGSTDKSLFKKEFTDRVSILEYPGNKLGIVSKLMDLRTNKQFITGHIDINKPKSYMTENHHYIMGKDYIDSLPHRKKLAENNLKESMCFLLYDNTNKPELASIIGFVSLHHYVHEKEILDKHGFGYENNWQNIIELVNKQLVSVIKNIKEKFNKALEAEKIAKLVATKAAHKINNQIAVYDFISYIIEKELNKKFIPPSKKTLKKMQGRLNETTSGLKILTDDLKQFGKPINIVTDKVNINQIIEDEIDQAKQSNADKIKYHLDLDNNISSYHLDKTRFAETIRELLNNAAKAIKVAKEENKKAGNITIKTALLKKENNTYQKITLLDDGFGIPKNFPLFEPFSTYNPDGTGLGLITAKEVIEAHQGIIKVKPVATQGACFEIIIPIKN